mmetsp:Transcript_18421/g.27777  ORF Transcript_18421/g.27777 Transcript_18421/m.27777 type:complete len:81 (+) Transcript_18421:147-389(+)
MNLFHAALWNCTSSQRGVGWPQAHLGGGEGKDHRGEWGWGEPAQSTTIRNLPSTVRVIRLNGLLLFNLVSKIIPDATLNP